MDENKDSPSDISSLKVLNVLKTIKKRKLPAEQFDLPTPKHKCWERATVSEGPTSIFYGSREEGNIERLMSKRKQMAHFVTKQPDPESIEDSNSYAEDSDSSTSIDSESKMEPEFAKMCDGTSSSSDHSTWMKTICSEEEGRDPQALMNFEEQLLEFRNHTEYIASENGEASLDQCSDKELEDILFANGLNSNVYVLSSGRWSVNQEAQSGSRKPTIDQEFEQYFSMLML